ncbi:PIN domain-containing protein [Effusibacillus consociatus]|uniref:Ribonuclease VapC n=1 Tax=Effusibacillus consociatus TaxID=1117041 RepID=A0ABV9Q019_9BACL
MYSKMLSDTNLLISYFAGDSNSDYADKVIQAVEEGKTTLVIPVAVVQELCHVFHNTEGFRLSKQRISDTLISFLLTPGIEAEEREVVVAALRKFHENNVDFTDAYLATRSSAAAVPVVSFDKDFRKLDCQVYNPKTQ